ncbi:esterase-like activity of phytase family protein [Neomegalonema sp.]|uniref:esterase-like activity of phytase family protein n=1 Tax=Neomegalonema sp. TaxID=2039713 RepID=UPI002624A018|nr:esterase-like activity of phytase family protein [Neomegalonema sp.]MDD2868401.1 esterase-like activity of phytase family protein [Neomegalonema sp.]
MRLHTLCLTSVLALCAGAAQAEQNFNRVASFATSLNMAEGEDRARETSAEIIAVSGDGNTLVYTDGPLGVAGLVDITDPAAPKALGNVDVGGDPTSVGVLGQIAFVAANTSKNFIETSGHLVAIDLASRKEVARCDLGGQPDSVAIAPDGSFLAVAIENERDEDLGDGRVGQQPAGYLYLAEIKDGVVDCASGRHVDMTGLAEISPEDPEPEFVDINALGETVVTLQENNHIAVVGRGGAILSHFSAGAVDLTEIDATDEGALIFTESQPGRKREPDSVKWIDENHFATANEGDMDGGSRGWTIFNKSGEVVFESGASFEHALIALGHYPDKRSDAKGVEPESVAFARYGDQPLLFIGSERGSAVGVYDVTDLKNPVLLQVLPSGVGPEGYATIPARNLLVSANETDLGEDGAARAHVMIFQRAEGPARYPYLTSEGADERIGWAALSGLAADPEAPGRLYAVNDSFFKAQPTIYTIDATQTPARITSALRVTRGGAPALGLDMEGVTLAREGGFWIANEGDLDKNVPHALYRVDASGEIVEEVAFPTELTNHAKRFGAEGIAWVGDRLWIAIQREWGDDPKGFVKLVSYDPATKEWGAVRYPLAAPTSGWVGLSEIATRGDYVYLLERDNLIGDKAATKVVTRVPVSELNPAPLGGELPVVSREVVRDLLPDLLSNGGYVLDKVEGLTFDAEGTAWIVTDNDGVDDSSGETMLIRVTDLP